MSKEVPGRRSILKKILLVILYTIPLLGLAAFGGYYFRKYNNLKKTPITVEQAAQAQIDMTLNDVGKLYALPTGEKPIVETVKDITKLADQPFYAKGQNGDITLIYTNAKLAILYRPSSKKIINVSTVTVQNGPTVSVIGKQTERQNAETALTNAKVTATDGGDAKGSYSGVTVVDLSGQNSALTQTIATTLHGQIGTLPAQETKPANVAILVIAGTPVTTP